MTRVLVGTLHDDLLGLLAGFAIEQLVRRTSPAVRAHLDTRESYLSCQAVWMLRHFSDGGSRRAPEPVSGNPTADLWIASIIPGTLTRLNRLQRGRVDNHASWFDLRWIAI